jgi:hypothetical protein
MRRSSKSYAAVKCAVTLFLLAPALLSAQTSSPSSASQPTCAGLLADNPGVSAIGPGPMSDSAGLRADSSVRTPGDTSGRASSGTTSRNRSDTASFGIGGARTGRPDIVLWVGVHADEVRFATQPHVRVRLCWGGDTLRVVQRTNIPSPVVAGTTYRNVYVAVELVGRLNGECLANAIAVGTRVGAAPPRAATTPAPSSGGAVAGVPGSGGSASNCAFLGGSAGAGAQTPRSPTP